MKKFIAKFLSLTMALTSMVSLGGISASAAVQTDGTIFTFDGSETPIIGWAQAGTNFGTLEIGKTDDTDKGSSDAYGLAKVESTGEWRFVVQGGPAWTNDDRSNYKYLVLTTEIKPVATITKFNFSTRGSRAITSELSAKLTANKWNTITTVYEFPETKNTVDSTGTSYTYVNDTLVETKTNAAALYDSNNSGVQDHLQLSVWGNENDTFGIDNTRYYLTNVFPDQNVVTMDGTSTITGVSTWSPAAATGFGDNAYGTAGDAGKAASDVYSNVTLGSTNKEYRWMVNESSFTPDADKYKYLVTSFQIKPQSGTNYTNISFGNRRGNFTSSNTIIGKSLQSDKWNTVTTVYEYGENAATATSFTAKTYVNGNLINTQNDARSIFAHVSTSGDNSNFKRIQLSIIDGNAKSFGLDNVKIYQSNEYPSVAMPVLSSGENYTVAGNKVMVHKGAAVAVTELTGVTVYDSTLTTQITSGNLTDGQIVAYSVDDKITYYTVETGFTPGIYPLVQFDSDDDTAFDAITGTGEWVTGIGGKDTADKVYKYTLASEETSSGGFIMARPNWLRSTKNAKYLVFDMNFYPTGGVNNFMLRTNGHEGIALKNAEGSSFDLYDTMKVNEWNKITVVFDAETGGSKYYLNGSLVNDGSAFDSIYGKKQQTLPTGRVEDCQQIRLGFSSPYNAKQGADPQVVYIDDVNIYESESNVVPEIPAEFNAKDGINGNYVFNTELKTVSVPEGTTADTIANENLFKVDGCEVRVDAKADTLAKNDKIVIESENKVYSYYKIDRVIGNYDVVFDGEAYDREYNEVEAGSLTVAVNMPADSAAVTLVAALFDEEGRLINCMPYPVEGSGLVSKTYTVANEPKAKLKAFVFNDLDKITPMGKALTVPYKQDALKILCIGSSYGVDGTYYVQQMAQSAGEKVVIANLYYGGCTLDQHYSFATNNTANYTYYKNTNGKWTETHSKTMLDGIKNEDWDIITIQAGAGDADTASSYDKLGDVIAYINANKTNSNAKLYWHQTWAYRDGSTKLSEGQSCADRYTAIMNNYNNIIVPLINNGTFAGVIPAGTAVQNARQVSDLYSWDSTTLSKDVIARDDTTHMSYEYGRYLVGLVWTNVLTGAPIDSITFTAADQGHTVDASLLPALKKAAADAIATPSAVTPLQ